MSILRKPAYEGVPERGKVIKVFTAGRERPRGVKVMLAGGAVGRVVSRHERLDESPGGALFIISSLVASCYLLSRAM